MILIETFFCGGVFFPLAALLFTDLQHCFLQPVVDQLSVALLLLQLLLQLSDTSLQPSPLFYDLSAEARRNKSQRCTGLTDLLTVLQLDKLSYFLAAWLLISS